MVHSGALTQEALWSVVHDVLVGSELEFTVGGWSNEWLYVVDGCWTVGGTFDEWFCKRK